MDDELTEYPNERVRLEPCQSCGRQFNADTLRKHQAICRKVSNKTRKVFDAGKQRATDSDVPYNATKKTAQIYNGDVKAQDDRSIAKSKPNWREKHERLVQSLRQARSVTRAIKQGAPLPAFRPSEVPSDYVACPYCHRNFNEHAAKRHVPFCQTQHERNQIQPLSRPNQQLDRGRTMPPQHLPSYKPHPSDTEMHSDPHDSYKYGHKAAKSAPMRVRRNPAEYQPLPGPPKTSGSGWGGYRKLFGSSSNERSAPPTSKYYAPDDEDSYESSFHRPVQRPTLMRTGRTQENTTLNGRIRQKNDETNVYMRRLAPMPTAPSTYSQTRYQYGNAPQHSSKPSPMTRAPPSYSHCGDCGSTFRVATARFCSECGSKR